jgi:general stress protein 26
MPILCVLFALSALVPSWSAEKATDALKKQGLDSLSKADYVIFNTVDENGFPQTRAMVNLHKGNAVAPVKDGKVTLYYVTKEGTNKVLQIRNNPHASAYYLDAKNVVSALYSGAVEEVKDLETKKAIWADWMKNIYKAPDDPGFVVIRMVPTHLKVDIKAKPEQGDL